MTAESNVVRVKPRRTSGNVSDGAAPAQTALAPSVPTAVSAELRKDMIEQAAYFRAEARGFEAGHELDDWLEAESEVDRAIREPS